MSDADKSGLYITLIVGVVAVVGLLLVLFGRGSANLTGNAVKTVTADYKFGDYLANEQDRKGHAGNTIGSDDAWNVEEQGGSWIGTARIKSKSHPAQESDKTLDGHSSDFRGKTCVDSDEAKGADVIFFKGSAMKTVYDERYMVNRPNSPEYTDKCLDQATLLEYSCNNGAVAQQSIACENGCGNGACL